MAEFVQQNMEMMIPELEQMERVGLFSGPETRQILKKRKGFEYKLQRKTKQKQDLLQYIQYEINLLALLEKRRKKTGYTFKRMEIDSMISQRIHKLFRIGTTRFQDDIKLWLSHVDFSKKKNEKTTVSKLFTRVLQVHNRNPDLWITAAKWELEENMNPENARSFFQRGIRFNPTSKQLWLEYYRMELLYAEKLLKRKEVLGSDVHDAEDQTLDAVLEGAVASVVYKNALEAFPDDVDFLLSFLKICQLFDFTRSHEDKIFSDVKNLFPDRPESWDAIAQRHIHLASKQPNRELQEKEVQSCYQVFQEAVTKIPGGKIWDLYIKACLDLIKTKSTTKIKKKRIQKVLSVFDKAAKKSAVTQSLFETWLDVLTNVGLVDKVPQVLELATTCHPQSPRMWIHRLEFLIGNTGPEEDIISMFNTAYQHVPEKDTLPLWQLVIDYSVANHLDCTVKLLERAVCCHKCVSDPIKVVYLQWVFLSKGIAKTRDLYQRFMQAGVVPLQLIKEYIKIENSQAVPKMKLLRKAYEDAVSEYGSESADIWIEYVQLELNHPMGKPQEAGKIHFRAIKCLEGELNQQFITQYTLLQTGHL